MVLTIYWSYMDEHYRQVCEQLQTTPKECLYIPEWRNHIKTEISPKIVSDDGCYFQMIKWDAELY